MLEYMIDNDNAAEITSHTRLKKLEGEKKRRKKKRKEIGAAGYRSTSSKLQAPRGYIRETQTEDMHSQCVVGPSRIQRKDVLTRTTPIVS